MSVNIYPAIYKIISYVSGRPFDIAWEEKLPHVLRALFLGAIFTVVFIFWYRRYFWKNLEARILFWWTMAVLALLVAGKYLIHHFARGYIPDRLLFFALPSPRVENIFWFMAPVLVFLIFLKLRSKIENLSTNKFLGSLIFFFFLFTFSVAGLRGGISSIIDPLTRVFWEYTGALPLVDAGGVRNFLAQFSASLSALPAHASTHPPGYVLFLYFWHKFFNAGFLGLSVILILTAGLAVFPLFKILRRHYSDLAVRRILQIFIFIPSFVMFSGTSMEAFYIVLVWSSIAWAYFGWQKGETLSLLAGFFMACALFSNFLFLLLTPFFLALFIYLLKTAGVKKNRYLVVGRVCLTLFSFILFFVVIWSWSGYSVIQNFQAARLAQSDWVESNFVSFFRYFTYLFMNASSFFIFLGLPFIYVLFKNAGRKIITKSFWTVAGSGLLAFLLLMGIFQGEVERIWLFLVPFALFFLDADYAEKDEAVPAPASLLFFQTIIFQTLFYTYW